MNDNGDPPLDRSDPFGMGLTAHRDHVDRAGCPFPSGHVEGRRWLAGWDHAQFRTGGDATTVAGRINPDRPA